FGGVTKSIPLRFSTVIFSFFLDEDITGVSLMTTPIVGTSKDFLAGLLTLFDFLVGSSGEAGIVESLGEADFLNFHAFLGGVTPIVISGGMHANLVSLRDCFVFSKEVVNDNFGESRVVHLVLLFVSSVVDLTSVDDSGKSSPMLMHLINNNIGDCLDFPSMTKFFEERHNIFISGKFIKVLTMNSRADLKYVSEDFQIEVEFLLLVHSEPVGIFILVDSTKIESSIAFSNIKSFLLGNKFQIKFDLLSSDGRHDSV
ncbi:hypothetical protein Tco_0765495, partial [Tanacetum coccineum]